MDLATLWFFIIAFLFTGYFVLEGFDFGVGMLLPFLGGDEEENDSRRTAAMTTIGPVWDGNEVWIITGGAAIFAAFPAWYATLFSGFYLLLLLILVGLILRGVGIEWRAKVDTIAWRKHCDLGTTIGSYIPAFLWGVAMTNIVRGVAIDAEGSINSLSDGFIGLLNPAGILGGFAFALLFALHGALFLGLRTHEPVRSRAHRLVVRFLSAPAVLAVAALGIIVQLGHGHAWTWVPLAVAAISLITAIIAAAGSRDGLAFALTCLTIVSAAVLLFGCLFPNVLPSTLDGGLTLTIDNASSSPYTLKIMTWAAAVMMPVVLIAQGFTYWCFRARVAPKRTPNPRRKLTV